ncbi:PilZ domain-containing protein [bacterium]|nr:PilZ domain-containing protein [bacterium]
MDELRKNHIVHIELRDSSWVNGTVLDYEKDRVMVLVDEKYLNNAKKLQELDDVKVIVHTHCGLKKMISSVISPLDHRSCIVIENSPAETVHQKRQFVRVVDDFDFNIEYIHQFYPCKCVNVSAGGIAFRSKGNDFKPKQEIKLIFPENVFSKVITCDAEIIKVQDDFFVAQYKNLNIYDENKIVKRIFELLARK